ncbi:MAPEG family protein [Meridianimarinicoccus sp. RP-17]|uniref:MAPEG family protein n=1 Tax=Meridianimarinicoccus zhengii TaxID=2056810 RepID=UPI000DACC5EA|nr:MAPEG family protein [Phycocomes zhengii]
MTAELFWLTLTALLAASLWLPFIVGMNTQAGRAHADFLRPPDLRALPAWMHRAHRAHLNLLEQFLPFAVVVLVAHLAGVSTPVTVWASVAFFWVRLAHAAGMISGMARMPLRPVLFTAGWVCILAIAAVVLVV